MNTTAGADKINHDCTILVVININMLSINNIYQLVICCIGDHKWFGELSIVTVSLNNLFVCH